MRYLFLFLISPFCWRTHPKVLITIRKKQSYHCTWKHEIILLPRIALFAALFQISLAKSIIGLFRVFMCHVFDICVHKVNDLQWKVEGPIDLCLTFYFYFYFIMRLKLQNCMSFHAKGMQLIFFENKFSFRHSNMDHSKNIQ